MNLSLILKILIGVTGYGVWAFMAYIDPTQRPDFLKFNIAMAVGTIGLVVRDMQAPPADKAQGGFASPALLAGIAALALLAGCAGLNVSWVATATYNTPATTAATLTPGAVLPLPAASAASTPAKP